MLPFPDQQEFLATIGTDEQMAMHIAMTEPRSLRRGLMEDFIHGCFAEHYGANIRHFMPCLLGLQDSTGHMQAALGVRCGNQSELFLERYIDQPVEQRIAELAGCDAPSRGLIAEVGNLAASNAGQARLLIVALTDLLSRAGFRWVAFTGTPLLLNSFSRLGLSPLQLGPAEPARMGEELADWGSYYATSPQVMVGDILGGHQRLQALGIYRRLGYRPATWVEGEQASVACG